MDQSILNEVTLPGVSVLIGVSRWMSLENWNCPTANYVVCQRLSDGHSALKLNTGHVKLHEAYPRVRSLGFMPSNSSIEMYPLEGPLHTLSCFFEKDYFETATEITADGWHEWAGDFMTVANRPVEVMMQRIHRELVQPGFGAEQVIEAASVMIAVEMARLGQQRSGRATEDDCRQQGLAPWQMRRLRDRLNSARELGYPRVQELAQLCGISRSHLMRSFKVSTGQSLHQYVVQERQSAARCMLVEDRLSIKEISAALAFCNVGHFTTAFRRSEGVTPSEFRSRGRASRADMAAPKSPTLRSSNHGGDKHQG